MKRYHHGHLREALITAALAILEESGAPGLTLRAVARRAGVSHMAPYHHFDDRQALVAAVAQRGFEMLGRAVEERVRRYTGDQLRRMQESALGYVSFAVQNPALYRVMFGTELARPDDYPGYRAAAQAAFGLITEGVGAARAQGIFVGDDPDSLSAVIWALLHGLVILVLDGKLASGRDRQAAALDLARAATQLLYVGLRPAPETKPEAKPEGMKKRRGRA